MLARLTKAYSYQRVSSKGQTKETKTGIQRQIELRDRWLAAHPEIILDDSLDLQDLGVSAFKGANAVDGALAAFLKACEIGKVKPGDYLLVESVDRISRSKPLAALDIFRRIIGYGVNVLTLADGMEYSEEILNTDNGRIYILLGTMQRAHNESKTKSDRLKETARIKLDLAKQGIQRKATAVPAWLVWNGKEYEPIEDRVNTINKMFELYTSGYTLSKVCQYLNDNGYAFFGKGAKDRKGVMRMEWNWSYIKKILCNKALIGTKQFFKRGGVLVEAVENYFPAVIDKDTFYKVNKLQDVAAKTTGKKKTGLRNLFSGFLQCTCGYSYYIKQGGKNSYLQCSEHYQKSEAARRCTNENTIQYKKIETAVLLFFKELNVNSLLEKADERAIEIGTAQDRLDSIVAQLDEIESKTNAWLEELGTLPKAARAKVVELINRAEEQKDALTKEGNELSVKIQTLSTAETDTETNIKRLQDLIAVLDESEDLRRRVRMEIMKLVNYIETDGTIINIFFKHGAVRNIITLPEMTLTTDLPGVSLKNYVPGASREADAIMGK